MAPRIPKKPALAEGLGASRGAAKFDRPPAELFAGPVWGIRANSGGGPRGARIARGAIAGFPKGKFERPPGSSGANGAGTFEVSEKKNRIRIPVVEDFRRESGGGLLHMHDEGAWDTTGWCSGRGRWSFRVLAPAGRQGLGRWGGRGGPRLAFRCALHEAFWDIKKTVVRFRGAGGGGKTVGPGQKSETIGEDFSWSGLPAAKRQTLGGPTTPTLQALFGGKEQTGRLRRPRFQFGPQGKTGVRRHGPKKT